MFRLGDELGALGLAIGACVVLCVEASDRRTVSPKVSGVRQDTTECAVRAARATSSALRPRLIRAFGAMSARAAKDLPVERRVAETAARVWLARFRGPIVALEPTSGDALFVCAPKLVTGETSGDLFLTGTSTADTSLADALASHLRQQLKHATVTSGNEHVAVVPSDEEASNLSPMDSATTLLSELDAIIGRLNGQATERESIVVMAAGRASIAHLLGFVDSLSVPDEVFQFDADRSVAFVRRESSGRWSRHELGHAAVDLAAFEHIPHDLVYRAISEGVARAVGGSMGKPLRSYSCAPATQSPLLGQDTWRAPLSSAFANINSFNALADMTGLTVLAAWAEGRAVDFRLEFPSPTTSADSWLTSVWLSGLRDSDRRSREGVSAINEWWISVSHFCGKNIGG